MSFIKQIIDHDNWEVAAVHNGKELAYGDLKDQIYAVTQSALRQNLERTNILFATPLDLTGLPLALGLLNAGVQLTILNVNTSQELFEARAHAAGVTHVLASNKLLLFKGLKGIADVTRLNLPVYSVGVYPKLPNARKWLKHTTGHTFVPPHDENRPALTVFTSGTTSEPKGVTHTMKSLVHSAPDVAEELSIWPGRKVFSEPTSIGLVTLINGGTWIIPKKGQCTSLDIIPEVWFGTPSDMLSLMENPKYAGYAPDTIGLASAPVYPSLVKAIDRYYGDEQPNIRCFYGMTEILPIAAGDAREKEARLNEGKGDYVGVLLGGNSIENVDGELVVSGPGLMPGYVGQPPLTQLATGDLGEVTEDGEVYLHGRKKNMLIRRRMNIYPSLYEPALSALAHVGEVALVGIPDEYGDDYVVLAVTLTTADPATQLRAIENIVEHAPKVMDADAVPDEVIHLSALPKSGRANKIDYDALRAVVKERVGR